jgi:hypothetical protein
METPGQAATHPANDAIFDLRGPGDGGTPSPSAGGGHYNISDISWSDVVVDGPISGGGLLRLNLSRASGSVRGLSFERLAIPAWMPSSVAERRPATAPAPHQSVGDLRFVDLEVAGRCVRSAAGAGFSDGDGGSGGGSASFACSGP